MPIYCGRIFDFIHSFDPIKTNSKTPLFWTFFWIFENLEEYFLGLFLYVIEQNMAIFSTSY